MGWIRLLQVWELLGTYQQQFSIVAISVLLRWTYLTVRVGIQNAVAIARLQHSVTSDSTSAFRPSWTDQLKNIWSLSHIAKKTLRRNEAINRPTVSSASVRRCRMLIDIGNNGMNVTPFEHIDSDFSEGTTDGELSWTINSWLVKCTNQVL